MRLFENRGFLRDCDGLNSLDSIKELAKILSIPKFDFQMKDMSIEAVCQNSSFHFFFRFLPTKII